MPHYVAFAVLEMFSLVGNRRVSPPVTSPNHAAGSADAEARADILPFAVEFCTNLPALMFEEPRQL